MRFSKSHTVPLVSYYPLSLAYWFLTGVCFTFHSDCPFQNFCNKKRSNLSPQKG